MISFENLEPGNHTFCVRTRDSYGTWSTMNSSNVYIEPVHKTGQIIAAEYFYDNDPGVGAAYNISLSNSDSLNIMLDIPVPADLLALTTPAPAYLTVGASVKLW